MYKLSVPDMSCNHCVNRITKALEGTGLKFKVSLEDKSVTVEGDEATAKEVIAKLDEAGYDAIVVK